MKENSELLFYCVLCPFCWGREPNRQKQTNKQKRKEKKKRVEVREGRKKRKERKEERNPVKPMGKHVKPFTKQLRDELKLDMQSNNCDLKKLYHYAVIYKSSLLKLLVLTVVLPVVFNNKRDIYKNVGNRYESLFTTIQF